MPAPLDHAQHRGWIESILRHIPGFKGYLEKEYRRDSDALLRSTLADDLQKCKPALDEYAKALVAAGKLEALTAIDSRRAKLDRLIARIRGAMQGYSGMFDLVQIKADLLQRVYENDLKITELCEQAAATAAKLKANPPDAETILAELGTQCETIDQAWDQRAEMLKGLE
ncbi:MAG TPA: hypothetical protein VFE24_17740 [Pirellulales bacterium]|jgi:hypothetical protein|nr:hypothetical protein [Pirellulales bacterium]